MRNLFLLALLPVSAFANPALETGSKAVHSMTGCYLVDYSYTETESLKEGYTRDSRVYDVNGNKSVKEWIYAIDTAPGKIRLQHILFATDLAGRVMEGSFLRHQAEDWQFEAPFLYDFVSPLHWSVKNLSTAGEWTRRITNLDDGLRYQCSAAWSAGNAYSEWSCSNFAPIPGRETRDMGRKDYNTLDRFTRVVAYGNSWLERQANTKTIYADGVKTPLAKELGKTWYVRLPDSECASAKAFVAPREAFWNLLRETWESVYTGDRPFVEKAAAPGQPSRYALISALEEKYKDLSDASVREAARQEILGLIQQFRE